MSMPGLGPSGAFSAFGMWNVLPVVPFHMQQSCLDSIKHPLTGTTSIEEEKRKAKTINRSAP